MYLRGWHFYGTDISEIIMPHKPSSTVRVFITLITVFIAIVLVVFVYRNFLRHPWTRDGQVRAQVVKLTARVTGPIVELPIKDNQFVKRGDLLWKIDPDTFKIAVERAESILQQKKVLAEEAEDIATRASGAHHHYSGAVSEQRLVQAINMQRQADATVLAAKSELDKVKLDLAFTEIYSPVDGYITHLKIHLGTHVVADSPILALVDTNTFWVVGFFKETLIKNIHINDKAIVKLMSYPDKPIEGIVESIGWGIAQDNGSTSHDLLPTINPTFDWIRLAQRIPVRVKIKKLPEGVTLRVGSTATVIILKD